MHVSEQAQAVMHGYVPELADAFASVVDFLDKNPTLVPPKSQEIFGTANYLHKAAQSFVADRRETSPKLPSTIADPVVKIILENFWDVPADASDAALRHHAMAMGAENIIGTLLEHFLASILEPAGWIWCSGAIVRATDFICRQPDGSWLALQVKNRDNSENSSSKAIRDGTNIRHWFRTFSRKTGTNWDNFPAKIDGLDEGQFRHFVANYLQSLRREA